MSARAGHEASNAHVLDRLVEYYGGELAPDEEFAIDSHLLRCAACRAEYNELGAVVLRVLLQAPGVLDQHPPTAVRSAPASTTSRGTERLDQVTTPRLDVTVTDRAGGGVYVEAAVIGLRPGRAVQLVVYAGDGRAYVVTTGVALGGREPLVGTASVTAAEVVFVVLVESGDGGALLVGRPG